MSGLDTGSRIGSFQVVRLIAEGPLADVYEVAHPRRKGRYLAKILRADLGANPVALERFRREAELTSGLRHPHIVAVHEVGVSGEGRSFVVSDYLDGVTLAARIAEAAPMSILEVLDIVEAVAGALAAADAAGVVHRNLTPGNIMLVPQGSAEGEPSGGQVVPEVVKVLDFGVSTLREFRSRTLRDPALAGTPAYLSPEQARARLGEVDHRSDQFSLAAIAYEMLSGRPAFSAETSALTLVKVARVDPRRLVELNPGVPEEMAAAIERAMYKVKEDRFPSPLAFLQALCRPVLGLRPAPRLVQAEAAGEAEAVAMGAAIPEDADRTPMPVSRTDDVVAGEILVKPLAGRKAAPVIAVVDRSPDTEPVRRKTSRSAPTRPAADSVPSWVLATPDADELLAPARRSRALGFTALMVAGAAVSGWALYGEGGLLATPGAPPPPSVAATAPTRPSAPMPPVAVERISPPAPPIAPAPPTLPATPATAPTTAPATASTTAAIAAGGPQIVPVAPAKVIRRPAPRPRLRPRPPRPAIEEATPTAVAAPEPPEAPTPPLPPAAATPTDTPPPTEAPPLDPAAILSPQPTPPTPPTAPTPAPPLTTPDTPPAPADPTAPPSTPPTPPVVPTPAPAEPPPAPAPSSTAAP